VARPWPLSTIGISPRSTIRSTVSLERDRRRATSVMLRMLDAADAVYRIREGCLIAVAAGAAAEATHWSP
jgi:hypothetical protein